MYISLGLYVPRLFNLENLCGLPSGGGKVLSSQHPFMSGMFSKILLEKRGLRLHETIVRFGVSSLSVV